MKKTYFGLKYNNLDEWEGYGDFGNQGLLRLGAFTAAYTYDCDPPYYLVFIIFLPIVI